MGRGKGDGAQAGPALRRGAGHVLLHGSEGSTYTVTPGVIDDEARSAYISGQCHALALALHEATGWQIWGSEDEEFDIVHVAVRDPQGRFHDITGRYDVDDYLEEEHCGAYGGDADFLVQLHPDEVRAFGDEEGWREPDLETARSFVRPLLEIHGELDALLPDDEVPDPGPLPYPGHPIGSDRSSLY